MKYCYITGTSRGIGKALAELLLDNGYSVIGIARNKTIEHQDYLHHYLDLSNNQVVSEFEFAWHNNTEQIILINNAGILGHINRVGNIDNESIAKTFNVNAISPMILTNKFIDAYKNAEAQKIILNISSGAGRHTINSWSTYSATKAAIDMYSQAVNDEQKADGGNFKIFSIAPGVVDTLMQKEIRNLNDQEFPDRERFVKLKENNQLTQVKDLAIQLKRVIDTPDDFKDILLDVRKM